MEHRTEGELLAFLDDELTLAKRLEVEGHLKSCDQCATELDELRRASWQLTEGLAAIDQPAPVTAAAAAAVSRRVGPSVQRPSTRIPLLRAAILVLSFAGVAGAAIPGSPVRGWVVEGWEQAAQLWRDDPEIEVATTAESLAAEPEAAPRQTYVSTLPAAGTIRILLEDLDPDVDELRLRWIDHTRAIVRAAAGTEEPSFLTGNGYIRLEGGHDVVIEFPWQLEHATIEVDGRILFTTDREDLASSESRLGTELVLPLEP